MIADERAFPPGPSPEVRAELLAAAREVLLDPDLPAGRTTFAGELLAEIHRRRGADAFPGVTVQVLADVLVVAQREGRL